ncbi:hypothetical protein DSC45_32255 [Streptomyces sp. YIM 130001]|nr:SgcJ/EcaC family oxidoreductase [Streptomyces sp. YIM 130001]RII09199.1 hypothetical protein DSC45_32255 [Streptomyces sp. YIM 130001]
MSDRVRSRDELHVHRLLQDMTAAWNAGDATAYADLFTEDADYVTWFGSHSSGREAIEESHRFLFAGPLKGTKLSNSAAADDGGASVRFLAPDVAFVLSAGGLAGQASVVSFTAVRQAERWRFASFQNTRKQEIPGPPR